ncbi:MAG: hypothetical protein IKZ25_05135 [Clostridia bacterium]|nr:hypothetical protein [Clostridia bacterium]
MIKPDKTVIKETIYVSLSVIILSIIMQSVFIIISRWNYKVLLGNILTDAIMIANFFFMALSVQKAVSTGDEKEAKKIMKLSQTFRTLFMFILLLIGAALPYFSTIAVVIPVFFPRIAIAFRGLKKDNTEQTEVLTENEPE